MACLITLDSMFSPLLKAMQRACPVAASPQQRSTISLLGVNTEYQTTAYKKKN